MPIAFEETNKPTPFVLIIHFYNTSFLLCLISCFTMADLELFQSKYDLEREKRWAAPNIGNNVTLGKDSVTRSMNHDPWVDYDMVAKQGPVLEDQSEIRFLIIGGGHCGILFAYHLISSGFSPTDIVISDEAGGFGGTWYWNRYPGLTCDVEGYSYLPLLEETGFVPQHRYSKGEEIRQNVENIASKYGIHGMFCTKAKSATWDDRRKCWAVQLYRDLGTGHEELNGDFTIYAQFIMPCGGVLSSPNAPDLPGLSTLMKNKRVFHTARWDYSYTGGSPTQPDMVGLQGKTVGIIGTGATAVQVVPELAKWAKHLYVFQRTPSFCGPREQVETTPESWAKVSTHAGWQYDRMRNLSRFLNDDPELTADDDIVKDGWSGSHSFSGLIGSPRAANLTVDQVPENIDRMLKEDAERAVKFHEHIDSQVKYPDVANKLKPWYPGWCKRPTFHQSYLQAFNRPNVTLVDTDGQGVQAYTERGVLVGAGESTKEYEVDLLVLATGFDSSAGPEASPARALNIPIRGRDGRELTEKWAAEDFATLFGVATHQFPNLFFYSAQGSTGSANMTYPIYLAAKLSAKIIKEAVDQVTADTLQMEVKKDAERHYAAEAQKLGHWFTTLQHCTPTYFTAYRRPEGSAEKKSHSVGWVTGTAEYEKATDEWALQGFAGFAIEA